VRLKAKGDEERKKKQVPHPSALRAYGLRMTTKGKGRRRASRMDAAARVLQCDVKTDPYNRRVGHPQRLKQGRADALAARQVETEKSIGCIQSLDTRVQGCMIMQTSA
jgi:hypothetical protein